MPESQIIHACCLDRLPKQEENSIDAIITDPPYEIGIVGRDWDGAGVAYAPGVWIECLRVLKPGGHLLAFGGTRTYHRLAVAIEEVGFEIRDVVSWIYGSGFPKSHNVGKAIDKMEGREREIIDSKQARFSPRFKDDGRSEEAIAKAGTHREIHATRGTGEFEGWGTALKPAQELIVLARKPLSESTVAANVVKWGTGALNIDATRIATEGEIGPNDKRTPNEPFQTKKDKGVQEMGLNHIVATTHIERGRWPANVAHDGTDEATENMHISYKKGVQEMGLNHIVATTHIERGRWPANVAHDGTDEATENMPVVQQAARYFYCSKASRKEREEGLEKLPPKAVGRSNGAQQTAKKGVAKSDDSDIGLNHVSQRHNTHPTVKPVDLMRWLCRMVTPPGGIICDPFAGSGTTGIAAKIEGFDFLGMEQDGDYAEIARTRIANFQHPKDTKSESKKVPVVESDDDQTTLF